MFFNNSEQNLSAGQRYTSLQFSFQMSQAFYPTAEQSADQWSASLDGMCFARLYFAQLYFNELPKKDSIFSKIVSTSTLVLSCIFVSLLLWSSGLAAGLLYNAVYVGAGSFAVL